MPSTDPQDGESILRLGGEPAGLTEVTRRLKHVWDALSRLRKAGLKRQATAALLRSYAGAASQYALQLQIPTESQVQAYDNTLTTCWQTLADRPFDNSHKERLGLPLRYAGCGAQFAETRQYAAYWSSAAATIAEVAAQNRFQSVASFLEAVPHIAAKLDTARTGLVQQGVSSFDGVSLADALNSKLNQSLLVGLVQKRKHTALLRSLPESQAAELRAAGGPGSWGFMQYPSEAICTVEDCLWSVSFRQRLGMRRAEANAEELATVTNTCCLKPREGPVCNTPLDDQGFHATTDQRGGGVMRRHKRLEKTVGSLIKRWKDQEPLYEQRVPAWDRRARNSRGETIEHAVLDIQYTDDDGTRWIDVSIRHPAAGNATEVRNAARRDGEASRKGERIKHERYPGSRLTPFVVETPGRIRAEARFWLLAQVRALSEDTQARELDRAYRAISCTVQSEIAQQLRRAAGLK